MIGWEQVNKTLQVLMLTYEIHMCMRTAVEMTDFSVFVLCNIGVDYCTARGRC